MNNEIVYWGKPDDEELTHEDRDEAIRAILDGYEKLPDTITIAGFKRMDMSSHIKLLSPLEYCLEILNEEYGRPGGDDDDPTPAMIEAEERFKKVLEKEYVPYLCDIVRKEDVDVKVWLEEQGEAK